MSREIQFVSGKPQRFVATRSFDLGTSGIKLMRGMEVEFDGTRATVPGHATMTYPNLRATVRVGWLVPADDYDEEDLSALRPIEAGIKMRPADGGNPMEPKERKTVSTSAVEHEEREVANVKQHSAATKKQNAKSRFATTLAEDQEGVVVRQLTTPAVQKTNLEKVSPREAIRKAQSVKIQPGAGRSREELMAQMSEEERDEYEAAILARKMEKKGVAEDTQVVAQVKTRKKKETEGVTLTTSVGRGVETADLGGNGSSGEESVAEVEGVTFRNTNGPKHANKAVDDATCRRIAKAICPDFPDNYRFDDPVKKKMARLMADYEDNPEVIRAVAAAETDAVLRQRLIKEFPGAFA